ncbi:MAG: hypothetical protein CUN49_01700 [Candidatus Thermofonsia Clade 1 bacterium]|uniref:Uncharacterized protein n=1 Tax=Candidatus Thermofonsia Clade 1 bacterium TaxID=2364210 RepID=A0A2M8PHY0_9CHLR|nr:MAG: hypothetical protein CUN49_01700 [Candidatus Thermofonsia Clade 1 bacterium]RMF50276.1 MAG: hypothetical protein D6749_10975 [Chloroflexota bacterium]
MPAVTEVTIPFQPARNPAELETRLEALKAEQVAALNGDLGFEARCELAGLHWALGEAENALENLQKALHLANQNDWIEPVGYLLSLKSAALCYIGQYAAAHELFVQAEAFFKRHNDECGVAWQQHLMAREYHLDMGNFAVAQRQATAAGAFFRARNVWHAYVESLLTQARAALGLAQPRHAAELLRQADGLIAERALTWFAPEYHWLRAEVALAEGTPRLAAKHCYNGLNSINYGGDLRPLAVLYMTLGKALEVDRSQLAAAQDAFERALAAARDRARSLHVAQAYQAAGLCLKRYSNLMTVRARGSGYLFEAERRFKALGLRMSE